MLDAPSSLNLNLFHSTTGNGSPNTPSLRPRTPKTPKSKARAKVEPKSKRSPGETAGDSSRSANPSLSFSMFEVISPRSATFDRLEGGLPQSKRRTGPLAVVSAWPWWKKVLCSAALFAFIVWLLRRNQGEAELSSPSAPSTHHPTSFETDPNPSLTTHCKASFSSSKPLIQYALVIDAGSTGSRIHIYKFNNCFSSPTYEYETFKQLQPGLSAEKYQYSPEAAAESLDELMDEALRVVPKQFRSCSPLSVKATAGLRLLGAQRSEAILRAVERRLRDRYPFPIKDDDHNAPGVGVMDGKDEGVYAWITANYLLETLSSKSKTKDNGTYAVLDLGGGSTQIVFQPSFPVSSSSKLEDGEHKYELTFSGKSYTLYQHSYLGYGLMSARQSIHRLVAFMHSLQPSPTHDSLEIIPNPCLSKGTKKLVEIAATSFFDEESGLKRNVSMSGEEEMGKERFESCKRVVELVLAKDAICHLKPCSFSGVYQPSLLTTFPTGRVLLLSYFYDRITPLLPPRTSTIAVGKIASLARDVCDSNLSSFSPAAQEDVRGRPEHCLDLTFIYTLLRLGYEFPDEREVELGKRVGGTEVGWCLGAAVVEGLEGGVKCLA